VHKIAVVCGIDFLLIFNAVSSIPHSGEFPVGSYLTGNKSTNFNEIKLQY